jgi:hypothetical protein
VRQCFSQYRLGNSGVAVNGGCRSRNDYACRNLAHAQYNIGDEVTAGCRIEFVNECGLEERELVQPDTVVYQEIELLIADLVGPSVRRGGFPDERDPVPAQPVFEQLGLETQTTSQPFENAGERIDGTESAHGGIIAKTAVAISRMLNKSASGVLASLKGSTYRSVGLASSLD